MSYLGIVLTFSIVNNLGFTYLLRTCPAVTTKRALGPNLCLSAAAILTMTVTGLVSWAVRAVMVGVLDLAFFEVFLMAPVVFGVVLLLERGLGVVSPVLTGQIGSYFPMLRTNCLVLGVAFVATSSQYGPFGSIVAGIAGGFGFLIATFLLATLREQLEFEWVPPRLHGAPVTVITGGLLAMVFLAVDQALLVNVIG